MGAIKEFYHDEICAGQIGADVGEGQGEWRAHLDGSAEDSLLKMEEDLKVVENSGVPKHLHSKF